MLELNPNHPTTQGVHDHWHKLCALVMLKLNVRTVKFTEAELASFCEAANINIVADTRGNTLTLRLVDDAEAQRLAKEAGGLPI